mgnify:CR=1 FL=1
MEVSDIIRPENQVFCKTKLMTNNALSYCPGCGHGTAHNLTMEVIDEMGISEDVIGVAPVGCSVLAYDFMNIDYSDMNTGSISMDIDTTNVNKKNLKSKLVRI